LNLVRETKGAKDFKNHRNTETGKIVCGRKHFEKLDVNFEVVVSANEV
jgi:restriction endonuclease